jgi:hypothetical protein
MSTTSHPGFWQNDFNLRKVVGWCGNLMQSGLFPRINSVTIFGQRW